MAQEHCRMKPRGLHAANAAAGGPNHSFSEKMSNSQITHLDQRTGNVCCLNVSTPGEKKEQADKCGFVLGCGEENREVDSVGTDLAVYKLLR